MRGARGVLINITGGPDMTLFEVDEAANRIKEEVDPDANIIVGSTLDESIDGEMRVSVVATGIEAREVRAAAAAAAAPASQAAPRQPAPSFRLRPQTAEAALGVGVPGQAGARARRAPSVADAGAAERARRRRGRRRSAPALGQVAAPAGAPIRQPARQPRQARRARLPHPPLPPQERFQEWGRLRAPVRELERAPSLFERVTASFGRQRPERAGRARARAPSRHGR